MKLELKHLAPYLLYHLKGIIKNKVVVLDTLHQYSCETVPSVRGFTWCGFENFKPILRPLSYLTKEIEVNGAKFVPIMVVFGGKDYTKYDYKINIVSKPILGDYISISVDGLGDNIISFGLRTITNNSLTYDNWQLLLSWHFDLFGLIEKGLAIDFNEAFTQK